MNSIGPIFGSIASALGLLCGLVIGSLTRKELLWGRKPLVVLASTLVVLGVTATGIELGRFAGLLLGLFACILLVGTAWLNGLLPVNQYLQRMLVVQAALIAFVLIVGGKSLEVNLLAFLWGFPAGSLTIPAHLRRNARIRMVTAMTALLACGVLLNKILA